MTEQGPNPIRAIAVEKLSVEKLISDCCDLKPIYVATPVGSCQIGKRALAILKQQARMLIFGIRSQKGTILDEHFLGIVIQEQAHPAIRGTLNLKPHKFKTYSERLPTR